MQIKITEVSVAINTYDSNVKGWASVVFNDSLKINGIKLIENKAGKLLVVLPEKERSNLQYIVPLTTELREHINERVINHYFSRKELLKKINAKKINATKGNDENGC